MVNPQHSPAQFAPGCFCVSADALDAMSPRHLAKTLAADTAVRMAEERMMNPFASNETAEKNDIAESAFQAYNAISINDRRVNELPNNDAQIKHIFAEREGHLADTPENRTLLTDLANDASKYVGKDRYGNLWNISITTDGSQIWARYQNGVINEGGKNTTPRIWDNETGLNRNPVKRRKNIESI